MITDEHTMKILEQFFNEYTINNKAIQFGMTKFGVAVSPYEDERVVSPVTLIERAVNSRREALKIVRDGQFSAEIEQLVLGEHGPDISQKNFVIGQPLNLYPGLEVLRRTIQYHTRKNIPVGEGLLGEYHVPELIRRVSRNACGAYRHGSPKPLDDSVRRKPEPSGERLASKERAEYCISAMRKWQEKTGLHTSSSNSFGEYGVLGMVPVISISIGLVTYMKDPVGLICKIDHIDPVQWNFAEDMIEVMPEVSEFPLAMLVRLQQLHDLYLLNYMMNIPRSDFVSYMTNATRIIMEYVDGED